MIITPTSASSTGMVRSWGSVKSRFCEWVPCARARTLSHSSSHGLHYVPPQSEPSTRQEVVSGGKRLLHDDCCYVKVRRVLEMHGPTPNRHCGYIVSLGSDPCWGLHALPKLASFRIGVY